MPIRPAPVSARPLAFNLSLITGTSSQPHQGVFEGERVKEPVHTFGDFTKILGGMFSRKSLRCTVYLIIEPDTRKSKQFGFIICQPSSRPWKKHKPRLEFI